MKLRFRVGILIETPVAFVTPNYSVKFTKSPAHLGQQGPTVTCYFRHLKEVFKKAGIEATPQNRTEIDRVIHDIVGVKYKNCPAAWKQIKTRLAQDEAGFVSKLRETWNNRK
jgi:hypothetical protein